MDHPLNIAHCVESYAPALGGMPEVVRQLSERMVAMGHRVTVFTSTHPDRRYSELNGVRIVDFPLSGNAVNGIHGDTGPYIDALRNGGFDILTFFAAQQWATDAALPHLHSLPGRKVFVPTGFSLLHDSRYAAYYRRMPEHLRSMDLNIFLSHRYQDIELAKAHGLTNRAVVPNGAASEEFDAPMTYDLRRANGLAANDRVILHIGSYTGVKGHKEALRIFIAADTPDTVLVLVGNNIARFEQEFRKHRFHFLDRWRARLRRKRILFLELDRPATVDALRQADLFLFPSRVECSPIVLFEALAAGVPFLATEAGNTAEIVEWTHGGWTMPGRTDARGWIHADIATGAKQLQGLLADDRMRRAAGSAGRKAWNERFTWQHIAETYVDHYRRLTHG
ncbi:MAG TPA: glycosyltransferase family 4 protein [Flavobacteriales bacterium]